jgi:tetratricopeptide (TPR) repeat protein
LTASSAALDGAAVPAGWRPWLSARLAEGAEPLALADELKDEADRQLHLDPQRALHIAESIGQLGGLADEPAVTALGHLAVADALRVLGRFREALDGYSRAAEQYLALGHEVGWARTRIGAALTWASCGVPPNGLAEIDRARAILSRQQLWVRLARLEQHVGYLVAVLGQLEAATACYQRALEAAHRLEPRDPLQEARILGNLAQAHQRLGDFERAAALHEDVVHAFEQHGQTVELAHARANSAQLLADQGHYSRALDLATSARRALHELGRTTDAAFVGQAGVHCLLALNQFDQAVALASEVVHEFEVVGAGVEAAATLLLRGIARRRTGEPSTALADFEAAETRFLAGQCAGWVAVVRAERAALLADASDWQAALKEAEGAANELFQGGQVISAAQATLVAARAYRALGMRAETRAALDQVVSAIGGRGVPWLEYQAWRLAGELATDEGGDGADPLPAFDAAIHALEQLQGRVLTEARASFLADKLDVYEAAVDLCLARGAAARAFEYAERAKSRALVDALAGNLDIRIRPRTEHERRLVDQLTRLRRRHERLTAVATRPFEVDVEHGSSPAGSSQDELARCERQIGALLGELALGHAADLERVSLLQGQIYLPELDPDTRLVEYFALGEDLCVFVGRPPAVEAVRLPGARPRVERLAARLYLALQTTALARSDPRWLAGIEVTTRRLLADLYTELFEPLRPLLTGAGRLVIVPHGALHRVPFAALYDGQRFLVERFEIVLAPSASAVSFCRRPLASGVRRAVVVAHSDDGALPGVLGEAQRVASLFNAECLLESQATRAHLVERAARAGLIHLATHGHARLDAPALSYLRLADGHLTTIDCFELELDCALVTLSACESGRAVVVPGDEPVGLPRALLYAGARSVLQTLWRVDDETTARLMDTFYTALRAGQGRGSALRAAQLSLLQGPGSQRNPFFWAPLVLVGDWGPLDHLDAETSP